MSPGAGSTFIRHGILCRDASARPLPKGVAVHPDRCEYWDGCYLDRRLAQRSFNFNRLGNVCKVTSAAACLSLGSCDHILVLAPVCLQRTFCDDDDDDLTISRTR